MEISGAALNSYGKNRCFVWKETMCFWFGESRVLAVQVSFGSLKLCMERICIALPYEDVHA